MRFGGRDFHEVAVLLGSRDKTNSPTEKEVLRPGQYFDAVTHIEVMQLHVVLHATALPVSWLWWGGGMAG